MATTLWDGRQVVYRCFDATGRLLYVGTTKQFTQRMDQHIRLSFWASYVARIRVEIPGSPFIAKLRESQVIYDENPRFNIHHRRPRHEWTEQDYRDVIRCLRSREPTGYTFKRIASLKRGLADRTAGIA
jgi:excinuclease UvrABC nuclease subunit